MSSQYKNKDLLKIQPFYSEEIKSVRKKNKKDNDFKIFTKKPKQLSNKKLSDILALPSERKKRPKRLIKYQILRNVLPLFDDVGILRRKYAVRNYAGTYEVKVMDSKSLDDSLFLAKKSSNDFFRDLSKEKKGFKYILSTRITFKKWNNATNSHDIDTIYRNSDPITVTNQRFNLNSAYEILKHRVEFYSNEGSGWIIDKIENIWINIANYDPLVGSSYFPLPPELNNSMKGLINIKNKDDECFKWCHVRFINPINIHPERINKKDKEIAKNLDYRRINFSLKERDSEMIEGRFNIDVNVFGYENMSFFTISIKKI